MFKATREAVSKASSEQEIEALLRQCLAAIPPHVRAGLPLSCQPVLNDGAMRIPEAALILIRAHIHCADSHDEAQALMEMSQTFGVAAARLAIIQRSDTPTPR
jgi:hypothetical protein